METLYTDLVDITAFGDRQRVMIPTSTADTAVPVFFNVFDAKPAVDENVNQSKQYRGEWRCVYCGNVNASEVLRCRGCGGAKGE